MDETKATAIFATLIHSFQMASMVAMGKIPDPMSGEAQVNLPQAEFNIDILSALKEKTRGNLTKEEKQLLETALTNLRLTYVAEVDRQGKETDSKETSEAADEQPVSETESEPELDTEEDEVESEEKTE